MNSYWIREALEYHGIPLKSVWDGERGEQDLVALGLTQLDYSTYRNRSKGLRFTDRATRLKLHQFIAKNATVLFDQNLVDSVSSTNTTIDCTDPLSRGNIPVLDKAPPFECFLAGLGSDRSERVLNVRTPAQYLPCNHLILCTSRLLRPSDRETCCTEEKSQAWPAGLS